jgi:membrane protein implicated in regulation of membrane protease activity
MARRKRRDARPIPAHPYRDTALVYGVMALVLVVLASLTGGDTLRATAVATAFFFVATAWTSWKFRGRIKERDAAKAAAAGSGGGRANGNRRGSAKG